MVLNSDIGFVHDGDPAEIKVDTFNFTKYGLLHGKVVSVSQDAIMRDKPQAQAEAQRQSGQTARSSEPPGHELLPCLFWLGWRCHGSRNAFCVLDLWLSYGDRNAGKVFSKMV